MASRNTLRRTLPPRILMPAVMQGGIAVTTWYVSDTFTTNLAAGSVNGSAAEPGPGLRAVTDTGNKLSLSSGSAVIAGKTTDNADPYLSYAAVTRAAGVAQFTAVQYPASGARFRFGFGSNEYGRISASEINALAFGYGAAAHETEYKSIIVLRTAGAFHLASGGAFGEGYKLGYVTAADTTASLAPAFYISDSDSASNCRELKVGKLGGTWLETYGPGALVVSGAISAGQTFTHEANFLAYFTLTSNGTSGNTDIFFRVQDATNYWHLQIANDGSATLNEVVSGSPTSRGTAAAGVFADGERCCIRADGTAIRIFDAGSDRIIYTSATNFQTATSGEIDALATGAALANLEVYPIDMSGADLEWLTALELG